MSSKLDSPGKELATEGPLQDGPVTAVVVSYASSSVIGETLTALKGAHSAGLLRCVVVDNRSPDETADLVAREHPWVELVRSSVNLGYGRGCNLGFERVRTPFVLFMNADVIIQPDDVRKLLEFLRTRDRGGIAAPATRVNHVEGFQFAGSIFTPWSMVGATTGLPYLRPKHRTVLPGQQPFKTDWVCGAVMMARSRAVQEVGGFDPRFFLYFEETDLCRRMTAGGWELWAVGTASADHYLGRSAREVDPSLPVGQCLSSHYYRSRYYYLSKHFGRLAAATCETGELLVKGTRDLLRAMLHRPCRHELRTRLKAPVFTWPDRGA